MKFYTVEEIAEILRVSEKTVRRLIEAGKLVAVQVGTAEKARKGSYRISEEDFKKYLEESKTK